MLILSNCLTEKNDEGCLKVANSLITRLKKNRDDVEVVSYERRSPVTDKFIKPNKFLSSKCVRDLCKKHEEVLYIPFPTKKWVMAMRVYLLSKFSKRISVILVLKTPIGLLGRFLLKNSEANIVVFSRDAADFYSGIVGSGRVTYLKTGVDTKKFTPVSNEYAAELKKKYGFDSNKKIVLHVGHLNEGRNIRHLMKISDYYQVLLVTSTLTKEEADQNLKQELLAKPNISIIDQYVPHIEELYQLSDVYFFPVLESGHCIDVSLSCLEAASCGKPVVTTPYGEMRQLIGREGFYLLRDFSTETINNAIKAAIIAENYSGTAVMDYDWDNAILHFSKSKERFYD